MKTIVILAAAVLTNFASSSWAVENGTTHDMTHMTMNPSREEREKMAVAHEQMAQCLRSERAFKTCHEALHKECKSISGGSCAGMEMGSGMNKAMKDKK